MSWLHNFFKFRERSDGDIVKPFLDHMEDLRWTIIKMAIVQVTAMIFAFYFRTDLVRLLQAPLAKADPSLPGRLIITGIADSFIISLELAFFAGIALAFPFHVYFIADFVLPALTRREKKYLLPGIAAGFMLFLVGVFIAYSYILPATIVFFWRDARAMQFQTMWTWKNYFSFSSWLCFGFGLLCELPVVVVVLALLGFVDAKLLRKTRPYALTVILVLTIIIAPSPDPMTFITLAAPIVALYELCIWVVWFLDQRKRTPLPPPANEFPD
jgi:sec-independent protein translocase protein TatC